MPVAQEVKDEVVFRRFQLRNSKVMESSFFYSDLTFPNFEKIKMQNLVFGI